VAGEIYWAFGPGRYCYAMWHALTADNNCFSTQLFALVRIRAPVTPVHRNGLLACMQDEMPVQGAGSIDEA
jgi:hypothetical protein